MSTYYCDCNTKRSEPELHAETCKYRMHLELTAIRAKLAEVERERDKAVMAMVSREVGTWFAEQLVDKANRLAAELAEARKDKERLDWLDAEKHHAVWSGMIDGYFIQGREQVCGNIGRGMSLRAAIDAAKEVKL